MAEDGSRSSMGRGPSRARSGRPVREPRSILMSAGLVLLSLLVAVPRPALAQEEDREVTLRASRARNDQVRVMDVRVRYGAGRFELVRGEEEQLYRYEFRYDRTLFDPEREWSVQGDTGRLVLGLDRSPDAEGRGFLWRLLHLDFDFDRLGDSDNHLTLNLSPEIPTRLDLRVGAAESRLDLGGLSVQNLEIVTGATSTVMTFDEPNRTVMEKLRVEAGAASFRAEGLGNARVREMMIRGGAGDVRLDFNGEWQTDTRADIRVGMGSVRIDVPEDLGVRIRESTFLGSFDPPSGFVTTDDGVVSQNWSDAEHRLDLRVEAVLGSVDVDVSPG